MDTDTYSPFSFDESPDSPTITLDGPPPPADLPAPPAPREPRRPGYLAVAAVATVCALAGGAGGVYAGRQLAPASTAATTPIGNGNAAVPVQAAVPGSYVAVAAKVLPSVVSINVTVNGGSGSGSGVIIRSDGYILTNNHVAGDATSLRVTFNDGTSATATLVGADAASDLAVIKVGKTGLAAATLGSSANVKVGDAVLAVGSPLGLSGTVTAGIVSALNRPVNTTQQGAFGSATVATVIDAIQTDAAINLGNSGGALVDGAGQVIGINSAIATAGTNGNIGVGFAIPIDQAKNIAQQLIATGHASRAQMGVSVGEATNADGSPRVVLQSVTSGGPADLAGLKTGDTIVSIGGHQITDADSLIATVRSHRPGETVQVTYERNGSRQTATVKLTDAAAG
jgi:putative serine protease PepD